MISIKFVGSFIQRKEILTLGLCWPHVSRVCVSFFEQVENRKNISNPLIEWMKVGAFFKAWFQNKVSNLLQEQLLCSSIVKENDFFKIFMRKCTLNQKVPFLAFVHLSWLCPHTRYRANIFSSQCTTICSTLWHSYWGSVLWSLLR